MDIISSPESMQAAAQELRRAGRAIGLVPTMGFLHAGHLSLIALARQHLMQDRPAIVLSLFVNPTQFGPNEDFASYPRDFERDRRLCEQAGVDIIFHPAADAMYPGQPTVSVTESALSRGLCGAGRPGHFQGVLTVVAKLFNLVLPDLAVFGQKDAQQLRLIQRMTRALNFPICIVAAPIVREPDGLAMSSRNMRLSPAERRDALCLVRSLQLARRLYRKGEHSADKIIAAMSRLIGETPAAVIDYIQIVDDAGLQPVARLDNAVLIALAVRVGKTRLIDNLMLPDDRLSNLPAATIPER